MLLRFFPGLCCEIVLFNHFCRVAHRYRVWGDVAGNYAACTNYRVFTDGYTGSYGAIGTYPNIIIDSNLFGGHLLMPWRNSYILVAVV